MCMKLVLQRDNCLRLNHIAKRVHLHINNSVLHLESMNQCILYKRLNEHGWYLVVTVQQFHVCINVKFKLGTEPHFFKVKVKLEHLRFLFHGDRVIHGTLENKPDQSGEFGEEP